VQPENRCSGGERLPLRIEAREGGQQRGVDVDQPVAPALDETGVEQPHEPGKRDQFDAVLLERPVGRGGETRAIRLGDDLAGDPGSRCPLQSRRFGPVADDQGDFGRVAGIRRGLD